MAHHEPPHVNMGREMAFDHTNYDKHPMADALATNAAETLGKAGIGGRVMDFGCGTGNVSVKLAGKVDEVVGVDIEQGMVDVYNKKSSDLGLNNKLSAVLSPSDLSQLSTTLPKPFDHIFSSLVFHHLPSPRSTLLALAKTLKPGGKIWIIDFMEMSKEVSDQLGAEMKKKKEEVAKASGVQEGHGHGHGHGHAQEHGHGGHGHDHGQGHGHDHGHKHSGGEGHSHSHTGYSSATVQTWFDFSSFSAAETEGVQLKDFTYEKAFESPLTGPEGSVLEFFVAGMTRV